MRNLVVFSLIILVVIAFLGGLNLGKKIQSIDTPVRTVVTQIMVTAKPSPTPKARPTATPSATLMPTRFVPNVSPTP